VTPLTEADIVEESRRSLLEFQSVGPLMDYMPYTATTERLLHQLAALQPKTLAAMHGSSFAGDCVRALRDLAVVLHQVYGESG
jgi:hypothetical protein